MKAIVVEKYGGPDIVELREVVDPVVGEHDVLIEVTAASVNRSDWEGLVGKPLYSRIGGLTRPRVTTPGTDVAGRVEAVGGAVQTFRPGDEVFGDLMYHGRRDRLVVSVGMTRHVGGVLGVVPTAHHAPTT